jgi:hypothetical protein
VPLIGVDNNTPGSCGLYSWLVTKARAQGIPVLGLEVSPLGNKHMLGIFPADHYAVKSEWGKNFLLKHGIAQASQVSVLKVEEAYLLWTGQDEYVEAYLETEPRVREALLLPQDEFVIGIPHHVTFLWEVRNILKALIQVPPPLHVVIRANPRVVRRQYPEREIVRKAHEQEIHSLPHVVVDETVGVGLLLQLADLMICPFAGTATERAALCRKPVVICQAAGEEGWAGEYLYWEPHPENLPALIQAWREQGRLDRFRFAHIASGVLREPVRAAA